MTTTAPGDAKAEVKPEVEKLDLGDLEEDDDFEEFPADSKPLLNWTVVNYL